MDRNMELSRRRFLQSAAAGAGLMVTEAALAQEKPAKGDDLHVGIIGVGKQGQTLMKACLKIPHVRFRAVCDIWPHNRNYVVKAWKKYYNQQVKGYADYQDMLEQEKDLDAVIVATPDWVHHEHAIAGLEAGLAVYCEKEMSNSIENARKMVETARRTGKPLQIGHQRRSNPRYILARELVVERKFLGRITHVNGQWNRYTRLELGTPKGEELSDAELKKYGYDTMERLRNWRWYHKFSGGAIADLGSHQVDIFNWFLNASPKGVVATGGMDYYETHEWYDNVNALYDWDYEWAGKTKTVHGFYQTLTTTSHGGYFETFMGKEGSIIISEDSSKGGLRRETTANEAPWEKQFAKLIRNAYAERRKEQKKTEEKKVTDEGGLVLNIGPSPKSAGRYYPMPTPPGYKRTTPVHQWHLENFFDAVRKGDPKILNCPAEIGYETAVSVLRVNEAVASGQPVQFKPEDFKA